MIIKQNHTSSGYNNLKRKVVNSNYAKYRCSTAFVVKIYNKYTDKNIDHIVSDFTCDFICNTGEIV